MRTRHRHLAEILTAIALIAAPFVLPYLGSAPNTVNRILVWGLFGIGFDILFGYTGLLSFGQAAFYGTGGMVAAYLLTRAGFPYVIAALVIGMVVGRGGGLPRRPHRAAPHRHLLRDDHGGDRRGVLLRRVQPAFRLDGRGERVAGGAHARASTSGSRRCTSPPGWSLYPFLAFCYFVGIVVALRIVRSPVGVILRAIRENPLRAAAVGHNIHGYKLTAFVIAAAYAGLAGRAPRRAAGLHAARGVHVRDLGPARHADRHRRARDALRPAGGRRRLALPAGFPAVHAPPGRHLEAGAGAASSCCWSASCARASSAACATLWARVRAQARGARAGRGACGGSRGRGKPPAECPPPCQRADARRRATKGPLLRATGLTKHYGGVIANAGIDFTVNARRAARHHRPQRRGQVDLLQDAHLRGAAHLGHHRLRGPRHHRHERDGRLPARAHQELPGEPALQPPHGAREPHHRRAGRAARQVPPRHAERRSRASRASTSRSATRSSS